MTLLRTAAQTTDSPSPWDQLLGARPSDDGSTTFRSLAALAEMGVTAVELMPIDRMSTA